MDKFLQSKTIRTILLSSATVTIYGLATGNGSIRSFQRASVSMGFGLGVSSVVYVFEQIRQAKEE